MATFGIKENDVNQIITEKPPGALSSAEKGTPWGFYLPALDSQA